MLPNLIIPGAQKSGTTSLCQFIASHPDCVFSVPKEPAFFSQAVNLRHIEEYEKHFGCQGNHLPKITAEGTTEYMTNVMAPSFMKGCLGADVKFIFVLRSPAARTYSAYLHLFKRGHDRRHPDDIFLGSSENLSDAIDSERDGLTDAILSNMVEIESYKSRYDDYLWPFRYISNSHYEAAISRYRNVFGKDRILVLFFEDMQRDPQSLGSQLAKFLDIDASGFPTELPHSNPTKIKRMKSFWGPFKDFYKQNFVETFHQPSSKFIDVPLKPSSEISKRLSKLFEPETNFWSDYAGRNLNEIGW